MFINIILTTCIIIWTATTVVYIYLIKQRKKDKIDLPVHLKAYEKALKEMDIEGINHFGSLVLWNENTLHDQKVYILNSIKSLVEKHPDLRALHKEAHYLVYGLEVIEEIL